MGEKKQKPMDINASIDILGVGKSSEEITKLGGSLLKAADKKINSEHFIFISIMMLALVGIVYVSSKDIDAFTNFNFNLILYCWFIFMGVYAALFCCIGFKRYKSR